MSLFSPPNTQSLIERGRSLAAQATEMARCLRLRDPAYLLAAGEIEQAAAAINAEANELEVSTTALRLKGQDAAWERSREGRKALGELAKRLTRQERDLRRLRVALGLGR